MTPPHPSTTPSDAWALRWAHLARAVEVQPEDRVLVALSGGADSVLLLHLLAASSPPQAFRAVHVDHGLRAEESARDLAFVRRLCRSLGVALDVRRVELDPDAGDLENRARRARYAALCEVAREVGYPVIATGHHGDDQLETLLLRWMRGSSLGGLRGVRASTEVRGLYPGQPPEQRPAGLAPLRVVRPLLALRRGEIRQLLESRDLDWVEDTSNLDTDFARNRVRHHLLPALERSVGPGATDALDAFARTVEDLERDLAHRTGHIVWRAPRFARATRGSVDGMLGGVLPRSELMALDRPLARRALWRLLTEATGRAPARGLLERILADLLAGRCGRYSLKDGWVLLLRAAELVTLPPSHELEPEPGASLDRRQGLMPWIAESMSADWSATLELDGQIALADGRRLRSERVEPPIGSPVPRGPDSVELDLDRLPPANRLWLRLPRPGDRFHPLGAPGSRPLRRFLADADVPREERPRVVLVGAAERILWVAGLRPDHEARVDGRTRRRLRLGLERA